MSKVTVAEKLSAIGNNMARVYDTGFEKGFDKGRAEGFEEGHDQGFEEGKKAEYDAFWDAFQSNGNRAAYIACFGGDNWNNGLLNPKYPIRPRANGSYMFYYSSMGGDLVAYFESIGKVLDLTNVGNANSMFQYSKFTRVGKIYHNDSNWYSTFYGCTKLVTIDEIGHPDEDGNVQFNTGTFNTCSALENITIRGKIAGSTSFQWSTMLTEASIRSIITHLSDTASGKTLTLSKVAVDNAFMFSWDGGNVPGTDETNPFWPQLRDSKPNWTITLV